MITSVPFLWCSGPVWESTTKTVETWRGLKTPVSLLNKLLTCHGVWKQDLNGWCFPLWNFLLQRYGSDYWSTRDWTWWLSSTSCPKLSMTSPLSTLMWTPTQWVHICSLQSLPITALNHFSVFILQNVFHLQNTLLSFTVSGVFKEGELVFV